MTDNQLKGRVALVTGAGDGLGQGIARRFAQAGAAVLIAEFDDAKGQATADGIVADGGQAVFVHCDITDKSQMDGAVQTAIDDFGSIDILVNNAYRSWGIHRVEDKTDEEYEANFAMNVLAPNWAMRKAFPVMKAQQWGRIINVSSLNGVNAHMGTAAYNASKEALRALTRTAAREWAPYGITANIICPAVASAAYRKFAELNPEAAAATDAALPMGRMGDAEADLGGVAVFLAGDDARYLTGNTLFVDGGSHINGSPWDPRFPES